MSEDISQNNIPNEQPQEQQQVPPTPPPAASQQAQYNQQPPRSSYYPHQEPVPPSNNGRRRPWIPIAIGGGCLLCALLFIVFLLAVVGSISGLGGRSGRSGNIALIRIGGVITAGKSGSSLFGDSSCGSEDIVSQLERARKSRAIKAIVLRINSPGGSPSGSEEVYNSIMRLRKAGKLVYTSMGDVAASGGYYIASASDKIYADSSTLTGSIGVIWDGADLSQLYKKIGYTPQVVKSGKFKDIGSSTRPMTPAERQLLQGIINDTYNQFVAAVSKGRHIPESQLRPIADGRVFTGNQALKVKLVDNIGGLHETVYAAAKAAGVSGEPKVVEYGEKSLFEDLFGSDSEKASSNAERLITRKLLEQAVEHESGIGGMR